MLKLLLHDVIKPSISFDSDLIHESTDLDEDQEGYEL